jgi:hypothetical protein
VLFPVACWELLCERCEPLPPLPTLSKILRGLSSGIITLKYPTRNEVVRVLQKYQRSRKVTKSSPVSQDVLSWFKINWRVNWNFLDEIRLRQVFQSEILSLMKRKSVRTIVRLLSVGVLSVPSLHLRLRSTLELKINVRIFSRLVPARVLEEHSIFHFPHLRKEIVQALRKLNSKRAIGYHGEIPLPWFPSPSLTSFSSLPSGLGVGSVECVVECYFVLWCVFLCNCGFVVCFGRSVSLYVLCFFLCVAVLLWVVSCGLCGAVRVALLRFLSIVFLCFFMF